MAFPPPSFFDPAWYLAAYPDVAAAGRDPLRHYRRHGLREGRLPAFMPSIWYERDMRWGLLDGGTETLEARARGPAGADSSYAAIALARDAARHGDWAKAARWLAPLDAWRDLVCLTGQIDPVLLGIEAAVMVGDLPTARTRWAAGTRGFGRRPDLALAAANIAAAVDGPGRAWSRLLSQLYRSAFLPGVAVASEDHATVEDKAVPAFDRLQPTRRPQARGRQGPVVSVIMPARNAAGTLDTALGSLCGQSWQALEILVVDNGSTDTTADIAQAWAGRDSRIRVLDGSAAPGTYAARNLGVAAATGALITVLDADDWAHPSRIARQVARLRRSPGAVATMCDWVRVTPDMRFTRWWQDQGHIHPDLSSVMIRSAARTALGFWDRVQAGADSEYHQRIVSVYGANALVRTVPGLPLGFGRLHAGSLTQSAATTIDSQVAGARRDYIEAARRWHAVAAKTGGLPLPQHPARRPFAVPPALALAPPDPEPEDLSPLAGLYDSAWYRRSYPDLRAGDVDGLVHYQTLGAAEGRDPGPGFSTSGYAMDQGVTCDAAAAHYVTTGRAAGASPLPVWDGAVAAPKSGRSVLVFGHQAGSEVFGAERALLTLLDRAAEAGVVPSVVLPRVLNPAYRAAVLARCHRLYVRPYGWRYGDVAPDPRTVDALARLIVETGAAEIHQNTCVLDAPLWAARAAGVPSVVHVHELPQSDPRLCADLGQSAASLRDALVRQADRFVVPAHPVAEWVRPGLDRICVLPNRVDAGLSDLPFMPESPARVALIGSLTARKGLRDVRAVAQALARARVPVQVVLIGPNSPDLAQMGRLPKTMAHRGYAASPAEALAQADIVLSLSHVAESFGLTVLEALCAGRPVVCYDRGTPPDLVGQTGGAVVPADQPQAVAQALIPWLRDPARLRAASDAARARGAALCVQWAADEPRDVFLKGIK